MKPLYKFLLLSAFTLFLLPGEALTQNQSTPEKTFKSLVKAIKKADMETYEKLWHPDRKESEGMVSKLKSDAEEWAELQGIFKGKQKITEDKVYGSGDEVFFKCKIDAPKAEQGGIGGLRMKQMDGKWYMWNW